MARGVIDQRSSVHLYTPQLSPNLLVPISMYNPTEQLALILKPDPTAFSDLDQLYAQILSIYPRTANLVQVLGSSWHLTLGL